MDSVYSQYDSYVNNVLQSKELHGFKSNPNYTYMLEHVSLDQGNSYYNYLKSYFSNNIIIEFCKKNDSIGTPNKYYIDGLNYRVSTTSLRYLMHAYLSLTHLKTVQEILVNIVELGCGYGGLCLAIDYVSKLLNIHINSYTCIDLDHPLKLQEKYLQLVGTSFPVKFESASTFGKDVIGTDNFLISNYCFSEIGSDNRNNYIQTLIPKISHGFMAWNNINLFDFGKKILKSETEYPMTGGDNNLYVYF